MKIKTTVKSGSGMGGMGGMRVIGSVMSGMGGMGGMRVIY